MSKGSTLSRTNVTPPSSWRRRSWILAGLGLAPMAYMAVVMFGPDVGDSPWWLVWVVWPVCLLVLAIGIRTFLKSQRANFDRSDPVLKDIKAIDDGVRWTGRIAGLTSHNMESTMNHATSLYSRLKIQAVSAEQLRADLQTTSGWTTPGTDITVRGLPPASPLNDDQQDDPVFQVSNTTQFARIDGLQAADDLARLVYLLREIAPQHAPVTSPSTDPGL